MYGPQGNPYQSQAVGTAGPAQLVLMLYDRALVGLVRARQAEGADARWVINSELQRVQAILSELSVTLDHDGGGVIAANLASLYAYCTTLTVKANVSGDLGPLDEVSTLISELRDAWATACCGTVPAAG